MKVLLSFIAGLALFTACTAQTPDTPAANAKDAKPVQQTAQDQQDPDIGGIIIIEGMAFSDSCNMDPDCTCRMKDGKCTCEPKAECPCCRKNAVKCPDKKQKECLLKKQKAHAEKELQKLKEGKCCGKQADCKQK